MKATNLNLRSSFCNFFIKDGRSVQLLYSYAVTAYLMAGLGFYWKKEFKDLYAEFTGSNKRTVYRHINMLKDAGMLTEKGDTLYIAGKKELYKKYNADQKRSIIFTEDVLKDKKLFKNHLIQQSGLILQARYRYLFCRLAETHGSSKTKVWINHVDPRFPKKYEDVGASLSKIAEFTGFCKNDIRLALKGFSEKIYQDQRTMTIAETKSLVNSGFFKRDQRSSYRYCKKTGKSTLVYQYSSVLTSPILHKRRG